MTFVLRTARAVGVRCISNRIRRIIGSAGEGGTRASDRGQPAMENLEPRTLMSAYVASDITARFALDHVLREITPAAEAVDAGWGYSAAAMGDITGDGIPDFAISAPGIPPSIGGVGGRVFLYSGADGSAIRTLSDTMYGFGRAMVSVGDVNGDTVPDLLVGSDAFPGPTDGPAGRAYIFSGADGSILRTFEAEGLGDELGASLAALGDWNNDGVPDAAVGAPGAGPSGQGRVFVFSGADGGLLQTLTGAAAGDRFGAAVAAVPAGGSLQATTNWLAVGAPLEDESTSQGTFADSGRVRVYDTTGALRQISAVYITGAQVGLSLATIRTTADVIVIAGGPMTDVNYPAVAADGGAIYSMRILADQSDPVYLSTLLSGSRAGERFGQMVRNVGDINGDGSDDLAVGRTIDGVQAIMFVSVSPYYAAPIGILSGDTDQYGNPTRVYDIPNVMGGSAAGLGDLNGDGVADVLTAGATQGGAGRGVVLPSYAIARIEQFDGWSDNGRYLFRNQPQYYGYPTPAWAGGFVIADGVFTPMSRVPGVTSQMSFSAIGNSGRMVGYRYPNPSTPGGLTEPIIVSPNGTVTTLQSAVTAINGPTDVNFAAITLRKVGPHDEVLLEDTQAGSYQPPRAWVLRNGVLTLLWSGYVADINAGGTVIGTKLAAYGQLGASAYWRVSTGAVELPKFYNLVDINDQNVMVGTDERGGLASWTVGASGLVRLAQRPAGVPQPIQWENWVPMGISEEGQVVARYTYTTLVYYGGVEKTYTHDSTRGLRELAESVVSGTLPRYSPGRVAGNGDIAYFSGVLLTSVATNSGYVAQVGSPRSASADSRGWTVTLINQYGTPVEFHLSGGQWNGHSLAGLVPPGGSVVDLTTYVDPKDGKTYAVVVSDRAVTVFRQQSNGSFSDAYVLTGQSFPATIITGQLTTFVGKDNKVYIAGLNADGELVLFYQTGNYDQANARYEFFYENLTRNHLEPNGDATPQWVGRAVSYVTYWNGLNIAGLDANGDIQVVWWAPDQSHWSTDNLSDITGAPPLSGQLAPYLTSWGGINIAGIDADGNLSTTWWVPSFEDRWETDDLTAEANGAKLIADSLTSYVTSWGGLNVAGIDAETGEVNVYWWVPSTNEWRSESISVQRPEGQPAITGSLVPLVSGTNLNIFGRGENGDVIRLYWRPQFGNIWQYENVTDVAVL